MLSSYSRKRTNLGVLYGFIAGLFFSLAAWGIDAVILAQHNVALPFLKFVPAILICLPAAILVGYLTARFENGLVGLVLWAGLAVLYTYMVINIPIKYGPQLLLKFYPAYAPVVKFEELMNVGHYWFYGVLAIGFTCFLSGILENLLIDQSLASSGVVGAILPLIICMVIMAGGGLSGDLLMANNFREPVVTIDTLLENGLNYYGQEVDKLEYRKMRLGIVRPLDDLVLQPYSLTLVAADNSLGLMKVLVNFDGRYALCHIVYAQPTYCERTYLRFNGVEQFAGESQNFKPFDFFKDDIIKKPYFPTKQLTLIR